MAGALAARLPLAVPDEGRRVRRSSRRRCRRASRSAPPGDCGCCPARARADEDALHRLGHVQPRAAERRVQRHDPVLEQPARPTRASGARPGCPRSGGAAAAARRRGARGPARCAQRASGGPGVVGHGARAASPGSPVSSSWSQGCSTALGVFVTPFGADFAGRRAEERQQLGRAAPDVLVRAGAAAGRIGRPAQPRLRDRLVWPGFILAPDRHAGRLA